jgi:hypothetical protein
MVDIWRRLDWASAAQFCAGIADCNLIFVEEPTEYQSADALGRLSAATHARIAFGERFHSRRQFAEIIEKQAVGLVQPSIIRVGGLTEAIKIGHAAETYSMGVARADVAAKWLDANGHLAGSAPSHLTPHTPEWFASLEQWDPPKAMMTRKIIELACRMDVCSICGDDPAKDYQLEESHRPPGGVDTLRLCDDCVGIRRAKGEPFVLLSVDTDIEIGNDVEIRSWRGPVCPSAGEFGRKKDGC